MATDNPVYLRLTRQSQWPSQQRANRLGVIATLITIVLALAIQLTGSFFVQLPQLFFLSGVVLIILGPPLVFIITALATGQDVSNDSYQLILLSDLSDEAIFAGHIQAAHHRLRLLKIMPVVILAGMFPMISAVLYGSTPPGNSALVLRMIGISTLLCGPTILAPTIGIFIALYELAIRSGVWVGLRWGRLAPNAAGVVLLLGGFLLSPPVCWLAPFFIFIHSPKQGADVAACSLWPSTAMLVAVVLKLIDVLQERAYQVLKRKRSGI